MEATPRRRRRWLWWVGWSVCVLVVGYGIYFGVRAKQVADEMLAYSGGIGAYNTSSLYLIELIESGGEWPASIEELDAGVAATQGGLVPSENGVVYRGRPAEGVSITSVCNEAFPLGSTVLVCEDMEFYGGEGVLRALRGEGFD